MRNPENTLIEDLLKLSDDELWSTAQQIMIGNPMMRTLELMAGTEENCKRALIIFVRDLFPMYRDLMAAYKNCGAVTITADQIAKFKELAACLPYREGSAFLPFHGLPIL
jgi:hypothetical protein